MSLFPALPPVTGSPFEAGLRGEVLARRARTVTEGRVATVQVVDVPVGIVVELAGPGWVHPWCREVVSRQAARALLDAALAAEVSAQSALDLAAIDPDVLGREDLLRRVRLADRVAAWAATAASAALADYAGPEPTPALGVDAAERHVRLEVRIARSSSDDAAARDITAARRLAGAARPVRDLWATGQITFRHVAAVLDRTAAADDALTAAVVARIVERLPRMASTRVAGVVTTALCALDPAGQSDRTRHARRHDLGVAYRSLPDGLAQIIATHRVEDARAIMEHLDTTADRLLTHRRRCPPCAEIVPDEIGPARAASHTHLLLGTDTGTHPATDSTDASTRGTSSAAGSRDRTSGANERRRRSRRGELQIVIDLPTLLGLAENPALLAGAPVPAAIARELATTCGSMRRIITDPVTGHLLDYGTRSYLPQPLKDFITARDGTCRAPGCGQPATRSQLDHITPFPNGPSNTANTHMLCTRDHDTKTTGDLTITSHHADGSATWTTRDGQTGETPVRPYLHHPDDTPPY